MKASTKAIRFSESLSILEGPGADIAARLDRIERTVAEIEAMLRRDRFDPDRLLFAELRQHVGGNTFAAGEIMSGIRAEADEPESDLSAALRMAGINSARGLSEWLSRQPTVAAQGKDRVGSLWRFRD